jgi:Domain of unknown function (DUF222)
MLFVSMDFYHDHPEGGATVGFSDYSGRVSADDRLPPAAAADGAPRITAPWSSQAPEREAGRREKAEALRAAFVQDGPADTLAPGALLAALTEAAFADAARLSDEELAGSLEAARRLQNRAHYLETLATAELARRRAAQYEEDKARGVSHNRRRAQFPDLELAAQLLIGRRHAQHLLDEAAELAERLPFTLAGMAAGLLDAARASAIASATLCLSDKDAAQIDQALGPGAHEFRADTVARRAAVLAMKLDPEAVRREREDARRTRQRVEARREQSGNASFSVRETDTSLVMSVKAAIDELAVRLRNGGAAGTLDSLRATAALDRLLNRDPFDRLAPLPPEPADNEDDDCPGDYPDAPPASPLPPGTPGTSPSPEYPSTNGTRKSDGADGDRRPRVSAEDAEDDEEAESSVRSPSGSDTPASGQAAFPALINLLVPAATLLGWSAVPGQAGAWGLTDPQETRDIVQVASRHPRTRWCLTVVNEQGEAVAHACADGRHPWTPHLPDPPPGAGDQPARVQEFLEDLGDRSAYLHEFLTGLGITPGALERIARGTCDHRHAEPRYAPSRKLRHLIRARAQNCTGPGCGGQSVHADQDHVVAYPAGPTDECNLHAPCRAHHRAKQAPDWRVEEPEPGILRWTLPNGRTRTTHPTIYDC